MPASPLSSIAPTEARDERTIARVLLRHGLVAAGLLARPGRVRERRSYAPTADGLVALEADLVALGFLVGPRLHEYLASLSAHGLAAVGVGLVGEAERLVGAHVPHVPLFRSFPRRVPADILDLYVRRVFALLLQEPNQPCVLCGESRTVAPVSPCAHLVCRACWDGADYSGCPICHRRIDTYDQFLRPAPPAAGAPAAPIPRRAVRLEQVDDVNRACHELALALLGRRTPLPGQDREDLLALLDHAGPQVVAWLPAEIPVRETKALVLAWVLAGTARDEVAGLLDRYLDTATDVLRLLYVLHGADPGLAVAPDRRKSLPRWLRRALLARLNVMRVTSLVEDMTRHRGAWLRMAENLHPFERAARQPRAAAAFAVLRETTIDENDPLGRLVLSEIDRSFLTPAGDRVRITSSAARVEMAQSAGRALPLLVNRPGDLVRRTVALAYRADERPGDRAALLDAVSRAVPAVGPGVLLSALGAVRAASWPPATRLFFPRGGTARMWATPDRRPRLSGGLAADLEASLVGEILRRAGELAPVGTALLDVGLTDLVAPFTERTASNALVRLPRGSTQALPDGRTIRLFLHWTEPAGTRVDLDLSVALYDGDGAFVGWCDYTRLRFGDFDVVHSGDLTSAPPPLGASEFVDLNVNRLRQRGIRYATMIVFSYNDVPFDAMTDVFAGVLGQSRGHEPFDPKCVEQRFDLAGGVKVATPLVIDLKTGSLRWIDATMIGTGLRHSVARYSRTVGRLSAAANDYFTARHRVSMWELACWHAAARATTTVVRDPAGESLVYRRGEPETVTDYAARLTALGPADSSGLSTQIPGFAALVRAPEGLPYGIPVYTLYPGRIDPARVNRLDASDLVAALAPLGS